MKVPPRSGPMKRTVDGVACVVAARPRSTCRYLRKSLQDQLDQGSRSEVT